MHSTGINAFNLLWKDVIVTMRSSERLPTISDKNPFDKLAIFPKKVNPDVNSPLLLPHYTKTVKIYTSCIDSIYHI